MYVVDLIFTLGALAVSFDVRACVEQGYGCSEAAVPGLAGEPQRRGRGFEGPTPRCHPGSGSGTGGRQGGGDVLLSPGGDDHTHLAHM